MNGHNQETWIQATLNDTFCDRSGNTSFYSYRSNKGNHKVPFTLVGNVKHIDHKLEGHFFYKLQVLQCTWLWGWMRLALSTKITDTF